MQVHNTAVSSKDQALVSQNKEIKSGKPTLVGEKNASPEKATESSQQKTTEQTSAYLKVLSRLENMIKQDELPDKAIESFTKAITTRLEEASDQEKKLLLNSTEAKALEIKNVKDIPEMIEAGLEDQDSVEKIFALLKQPQFVELMNGEEKQAPQTYGPDGKPATPDKADNSASAQVMSKGAPKEGEINSKQAMQMLKAMQAAKTATSSETKQSITAA